MNKTNLKKIAMKDVAIAISEDLKNGDITTNLLGKDKNKTGEIIELDIKRNRAKIKGINMIKKHLKTTKERKGGIVDKENFVHLSNLKLDQKQDKKKEVKKWYQD